MAMGCPGGAEQCQGIFGEGNVPVFGALAAVDMDLETRAIDVGALEEEGFVESESQAIDGGEVDLVVQGGGRREESFNLLYAEDGGEPVGGLRTQERQRGPVTLQDVLIEEADATVADTHRRRGQAIDVFAVQEVALQLLFRKAVGGLGVELSQQADFPDIGVLCPFALATELKSRDHLLTQWAHETSPFVRQVVCVRRETS
jgi:hypothetical protein